MNEAAFSISIKDSIELFKSFEILRKENYCNIRQLSYDKFSLEFLRASRKDDYMTLYRCALENDDYDILLTDNSFIQFSYDYDIKEKSENIRLAYYPSICTISYNEFLSDQLGASEEEYGAEFMDDYQQFLLEQEPAQVTPLRFDYNKKLYNEIIHSSAHIHYGLEENVRVPVNIVAKPLLFSKLIIEYYFFNKWKRKIEIGDTEILYKTCEFEKLPSSLFTEEDKKIPFLFIKN